LVLLIYHPTSLLKEVSFAIFIKGETMTGKPTDRQIHLRLTHELAVTHNPLEETSHHQTNRRLRADGGSTNYRSSISI